MAWALLLALLLVCTCGASREEQTINPDVAFLRLGPNAVCGDAVAGHTLICFDPATPVPIGFGATLRVSPAQLTIASGNTTIGITAQGAVVVNGAAAGPPGTLTLAGTRINRIDGVWTVLRETLLSPSGAVQEVCVISTTVCGIRLVLSADEPSIAVVAGNRIIIDDDIPLPFVLGALSSGTAHVISRWSIFSAQSHGELVIETQIPIDGTTTCRLHQFVNSSRCGRAYYRHVCGYGWQNLSFLTLFYRKLSPCSRWTSALC